MKLNGPETLVNLAVAIGATTPVPAGAGSVVWSTLAGAVLVWSGASWQLAATSEPLVYKSGWYLDQKSGYATQPLTLNRVYFLPWYIARALSLSAIACYVVSGGALSALRIGVYSADANNMPTALLLDLGTAPSTASGSNPTCTCALTIGPGMYWFAVAAQNSGATAPSLICVSIPPYALPWSTLIYNSIVGYYADGVTGALPATPTLTAPTTFTPKVWLVMT